MNFHEKPLIYTGEVHLNVTNLEKSVQYYKEVIGFKVLEEKADKVVLTADGKKPLLIIEQPENITPKEPHRSGLYHFALLLPERADLGAIIKHFVQHNVRLGASDHLVSEALYLSDPDGNGIEIYTDRPPSVWSWENGQVAMSTDPLDGESIIAESGGRTWEGLPDGTVMGHVHLHVAHLPETETFLQCAWIRSRNDLSASFVHVERQVPSSSRSQYVEWCRSSTAFCRECGTPIAIHSFIQMKQC